MSLDIEQYGTMVMVEKVFQRIYMTTIYAVNPPTVTPQSRMGRNMRNIPMMSRMPPKNIYGFLLPHLPRVLSLMNPMTGSVMASQNFATNMIVDATPMAIPLLVMYFIMTHDISATPPPSMNAPHP